jgi:SHS family lactate transporter-like MFS transporter
MSGIYQSGYTMGYVLAVIFYKAFHNTPQHWRALFYFGSSIPVILIIYRLCIDETDAWEERKHFQNQQATLKEVWEEVGSAIKKYWRLMLYLAFLIMGMMYLVSFGTPQCDNQCAK